MAQQLGLATAPEDLIAQQAFLERQLVGYPSLRKSQSSSQLDRGQHSLISRGTSSPNLSARASPEASPPYTPKAYSPKAQPKRKSQPMISSQGWNFWRAQPLPIVLLLLAVAGAAYLLLTDNLYGLVGLRLRGEQPHVNSLMQQGVPQSLMHANFTAAYARSLCASSKGTYLLRTQDWTDGPVCNITAGSLKALSGENKTMCSELLRVPKVAMLFLGTTGFPHAAMWGNWFQQAGGLLPSDCLTAAVCSAGDAAAQAEALNLVLAACGPASTAPGLQELVDRQHMFSVYVHLPPNKTLEGPPTIFSGREIPDSIITKWGEWSLADASRVLIREALKDPLNQRFIMLSESCAPLYPPAVVYQQLMYEPKSRINACDHPDHHRDNYRYTWRMAPALEERHWRKSFQWFGVVRKHARVIAEDTKIAKVFEEHCVSGWDSEWNRWHTCFSDEHYFATVLATEGLDEETDCKGGMTHTEWCNPCATNDDKLHPRAYKAEEVSLPMLAGLREAWDKGCNDTAALAWAAHGYLSAAQLAAGQACGTVPIFRDERAMLGWGCPVFARKFKADTAATLLQAVFAMLMEEKRARPQGLLVADSQAGDFHRQCKALARKLKARKQLSETAGPPQD